jgi:transposase-like protein
MRVAKHIIAFAVAMHIRSQSLSQASQLVSEVFGVRVSGKTILKWRVKYGPRIAKMLWQIRPGSSGIWELDETMVKIKGEPWWVWIAIDHKTRYIIAIHMSRGRAVSDAVVFLKKARDQGEWPRIIWTDGLQSYNIAIKKVFYRQRAELRVVHMRSPGLLSGHKNRIERVNGTVKDRYKTMRGFKDLEAAGAFLEAFVVFYNFLRTHTGLRGLTPAQASGVHIPFPANDGWAALIDWSAIFEERMTWPKDGPQLAEAN